MRFKRGEADIIQWQHITKPVYYGYVQVTKNLHTKVKLTVRVNTILLTYMTLYILSQLVNPLPNKQTLHKYRTIWQA